MGRKPDMPNPSISDFGMKEAMAMSEKYLQTMLSPFGAMVNQLGASWLFSAGFTRYANEFLIPFALATIYFQKAEQQKLVTEDFMDSLISFAELLQFNQDITNRNLIASMKAVNDYNNKEMKMGLESLANSIFQLDGMTWPEFARRQARIIHLVNQVYPKAILDIEPEFGFHFERGEDPLFAETDRFLVYRVMPKDKNVISREDAKPVFIIPPYVLGANILAFLPNEKKSYAHAFANMGIPTYIRIMKNILTTPALQVMHPEDDAKDTRYFCEKMKQAHGKPVTLNGYCQGGYSAVCNILSGELDGLVDALLTCVSPMDGTKSKGLSGFLSSLPQRFNDLLYGTKKLKNGNRVADGKLMAWVYKLKSIENEGPLVAYIRDLMMLRPKNGEEVKISKTAAAINYWLAFERSDLPMTITNMSFRSYNIPVTEDGTLPVSLFGKKLNFRGIREKKIPWLICYGESDDLVEKEVATAPANYTEVELSGFPKGHVAIATSWSNPKSPYALHTVFGENKMRGPVRFQLDLDEELEKKKIKENQPVKSQSPKKGEEKPEKAGKDAQKKTRGKTPAKGKKSPGKKKTGKE